MDEILDGTFDKPLHRFNCNIPVDQNRMLTEAENMTEQISSGFSEWAQSQVQGTKGDVAALMKSARMLQSFLDLKYLMKSETKVMFLRQMKDIAYANNAPLHIQVKMFQMMQRLLKKRTMPIEYEVSWQPSYALLLKHYLRPSSVPPSCSAANEASHRSALCSLIYHQRHYYPLQAASEIWEQEAPTLRELGQRNCFRALAMLVLFLPSRNTLYPSLLPEWLFLWASVDGCPEWDACWLILLCRARKHTSAADWASALPQLFAQAMYSLQLPVGKGQSDRSRKFPVAFRALLQEAIGGGDEGLCMMRKLAKLLVFTLGHGPVTEVELPTGELGALQSYQVSEGTRLLLQLLKQTSTYTHPSNSGSWSNNLAFFIGWVCAGLARRVGEQWGIPSEDGRGGLQGAFLPITKGEVHGLVRTLFPLVQSLLYSKSANTVDVAQRALKHLCRIAPFDICAPAMDIIAKALDPSSVNQTHQVVPALRALGLLVHPLLYPRPLLAPYLPTMLELSLPGLDANDTKKTMATLGLYHHIFSWIPIAGEDNAMKDDTLKSEFPPLLFLDSDLPESKRGGPLCGSEDELYEALERTAGFISAWVPRVMESLFKLVENLEAPSKGNSAGNGLLGKLAGQFEVAMLFSLSRCVWSLFERMDDKAHKQATLQLANLISEKCLSDAVKKVALFVEACVDTRNDAALQVLMPRLMDGLPGFSTGNKKELATREIVWRLRLLAAACKHGGNSLVLYEDPLVKILEVCYQHEDKKIRKNARKLLRHLLTGLVECYPSGCQTKPQPFLGKPLTFGTEVDINWYTPSEHAMTFAMRLFELFARGPMRFLKEDMSGGTKNGEGSGTSKAGRERAELWRTQLKTLLYTLRGGSAALVDGDGTEIPIRSGYTGYKVIPELRQQIAEFLHQACSFVKTETSFEGDVKILKALMEPVSWLLTRRSSKAHAARFGLMFLKHFKGRVVDQIYAGRKKALQRVIGRDRGVRLPSNPPPPLGGNCVPFHCLVERAFYQYLTRLREASFAVPHYLKGGPLVTVYESLMEDLLYFGTRSMYASTREKAQGLFESASAFFSWVAKQKTQDVVAVLNKEGISHEEGTGTCYLLSQKRWMRYMAGRWTFASMFLTSLCRSHRLVATLPTDRQPKMASRVQMLFGKYLAAWQSLPIKDDQDREDYFALIQTLLEMVSPVQAAATQPLHWRYEMMITWVLISLLRADTPPPQGITSWLLKTISRDNGQPLQRLGLFGFLRILVLHPDAMRQDFRTILLQESTLMSFCWALLYNHIRTTETEVESSEAARWSAGVTEMLGDAGREGRDLFPHARLHHSSTVFKTQNCRITKALVKCCGEEAVPLLLRCVLAMQETAAEEDKQKAHATVTEVVAGALRALNKEVATIESIWTLILPVIQELMSKASLDLTDDLADSIMYSVAKRPFAHFQPILDHIIGQIRLRFGANENRELQGAGTEQAKWLKLLIPLLAEAVSFKASRNDTMLVIKQDILPLVALNHHLAHPFKIVREQLSMLLFVTGPFLGRLGALSKAPAVESTKYLIECAHAILGPGVDAEEVLQKGLDMDGVSAEREHPEPNSADKGNEEETGKSERARIIETVVGWVYFAAKCGDCVAYLQDIVPLLPVIMEGVRDPEPHTQKASVHALSALSQALNLRRVHDINGLELGSCASSPSMFQKLVPLLVVLSGHSSWYSRRACLEFIGVFQAHHHFSLSAEDHSKIQSKLIELLADERKEAQDTACYALTTRIAYLEHTESKQLASRFEEMSSACLKKHKLLTKKIKASKSDEEKNELNEKHSSNVKKHKKAVLGLSSVILSSPYDLPVWLPSSLTSLGGNEGLHMGIGDTVMKTFAEFKRTHQDNWEVHRQKFTQEQLDIVNGMLVSPSYYA